MLFKNFGNGDESMNNSFSIIINGVKNLNNGIILWEKSQVWLFLPQNQQLINFLIPLLGEKISFEIKWQIKYLNLNIN